MFSLSSSPLSPSLSVLKSHICTPPTCPRAKIPFLFSPNFDHFGIKRTQCHVVQIISRPKNVSLYNSRYSKHFNFVYLKHVRWSHESSEVLNIEHNCMSACMHVKFQERNM